MHECVGGFMQHFPLPANKAHAKPWSFGMLDWSPMEHEPIYTSPHFDFLFYLDTPALVSAIRLGPCWG